MSNVTCVLVTFNPDIKLLERCISSILANGARLIVVDNGSVSLCEVAAVSDGNSVLIERLGKNYGIAYAQNHGIRLALEGGADFIWLSDQDSVYESDYVIKMLRAFEAAAELGYSDVAAIAPTFYDTNRGAIQPIVKFAPFTSKFLPEPGLNRVSHVIASGMLIPAGVLDVVGLKQDSLFIDWVDMEWCWRAHMKYGYDIYVNGAVQMTHSLGDCHVELFGRKLILRSPFRHYFMVRNAIAIALYSEYLAFPVRLELFFKALVWMMLFPLLAPTNRLEHFRSTMTGFIQGVFNRLGPK